MRITAKQRADLETLLISHEEAEAIRNAPYRPISFASRRSAVCGDIRRLFHSYEQAAKFFKVPETTIHDWCNGVQSLPVAVKLVMACIDSGCDYCHEQGAL